LILLDLLWVMIFNRDIRWSSHIVFWYNV